MTVKRIQKQAWFKNSVSRQNTTGSTPASLEKSGFLGTRQSALFDGHAYTFLRVELE